SIVMLSTVAVTVLTHDLAKGVFVGVLLSALFFAAKVGRLFRVESTVDESGMHRSYRVRGQVFFASSGSFVDAFNFKEALDRVTIDVTEADFWDITAVHSLDKVLLKFKREGTIVDVIGMNEASA